MELKEIKQVEKSDIDNLKMLRAVIQSANFDVKGNAIEKVAFLFRWMQELELKIEGELQSKILANAKDGAPKIKKVGK